MRITNGLYEGNSALVYGSICSGIEAATVAWEPLGWRPAFFSEIDAFPRAVLSHRFPIIPLHGDFTTIQDGEYEPIDLLVGGTPCQDFSVAGKREGLDGDRGNLTLEYAHLARRLRPRWLVWENVPGVFSNNDGADFGAILACFAGGTADQRFNTPKNGWQNAGIAPPLSADGYGLAWRVLDAQYAGVPQRRRRIYLVGYFGDWRYPAAVLFERHSLQGHSPPSREAGKSVATTLTSGAGGGCGPDDNSAQAGHTIPATPFPQGSGLDVGTRYAEGVALRGREGGATAELTGPIAPALRCGGGGGDKPHVLAFDTTQITSAANRSNPKAGNPYHILAAGAHPPAIAFSCKDHGADAGEIAPTLRAMGHSGSHAHAGGQIAVAFNHQAGGTQTTLGYDPAAGVSGCLSSNQTPAVCITGEIAHTLKAEGFDASEDGTGRGQPLTPTIGGVRRLLPIECERLQGLPDNHTNIPYRNSTAKDGPRYKAIGNSKPVPVVRWIGERIQMVEDLINKLAMQ